jgi:hypothetical protein
MLHAITSFDCHPQPRELPQQIQVIAASEPSEPAQRCHTSGAEAVMLNNAPLARRAHLTIQGLRARNHVISALPLGASLTEAEAIRSTAEERGLRVSGAIPAELSEQMCRDGEALRAGSLGRILGAESFTTTGGILPRQVWLATWLLGYVWRVSALADGAALTFSTGAILRARQDAAVQVPTLKLIGENGVRTFAARLTAGNDTNWGLEAATEAIRAGLPAPFGLDHAIHQIEIEEMLQKSCGTGHSVQAFRQPFRASWLFRPGSW